MGIVLVVVSFMDIFDSLTMSPTCLRKTSNLTKIFLSDGLKEKTTNRRSV